jgi:hypothetical protein
MERMRSARLALSVSYLALGCGANAESSNPTTGGSGGQMSAGGSLSGGGTVIAEGSGGGGASMAGGASTDHLNGTAGSTGMAGSNDAGGSECKGPASAGLPGSAPVLEAGVWKDISPAGLTFGSDLANAKGFAIDPCHRATLYLCISSFDPGGQRAGLYKSIDAGSTWAKVGNLDEPWRVRVDPGNNQHLYAGDGVRGSTMGFWVSWDGGNTWAKPKGWSSMAASLGITSSSGMDDVYDVAVDPTDFNHVLTSFHSPWTWGDSSKGAGVLESIDGGETWIVHGWPNTRGQGHGIWFLSNSKTWLLGTQGAGYWRTTDAGANWVPVTTANMAHGGGGIYYAKTGVLYASSWDEVIRSTDDGVTWAKVGTLKYTTSIIGDGNYLYTHKQGSAGPFYVSAETDGLTWSAYQGGAQSLNDGPFEMTFDAENGILYASNWTAGMWALKVKP